MGGAMDSKEPKGKKQLKNPDFHQRLTSLIGDEQPYPWATRLGLSGGAWNRIWQQGTVPSYELLLKIVAGTGVSLDWLLTGYGQKWRKDMAPASRREKIDTSMLAKAIQIVEEEGPDRGLDKLSAKERADYIVSLYDGLLELREKLMRKNSAAIDAMTKKEAVDS